MFELSENDLCANWKTGDTYKKRIKLAAAFCAERHLVYIRKETKGLPKPWTNDLILRSYRFCNIYRELDKVTGQIMEDWINPNLDNQNISCLAILGRLINFPDTLEKLSGIGIDFQKKPSSKMVWDLLNRVKAEKGQIFTGVYIVNTVFPKDFVKVDGSKADYLANFFIPMLWEKRKSLHEALASGSFRETCDGFKKIHGVGAFLSNQAAVDLSYTRWLKDAGDIDTTWNPGPGTCKGIRRITGNYNLSPWTEEMNTALTKYRDDLNEELSKHPLFSENLKSMTHRIVPVSGPNASNSLCEISKHYGMVMGERERLKNTYGG